MKRFSKLMNNSKTSTTLMIAFVVLVSVFMFLVYRKRMSENFGYIDIILLAIMAGFILLRLRNTLGKGADNMPMQTKFTQNQVAEDFVKPVTVKETKKSKLEFEEKIFKIENNRLFVLCMSLWTGLLISSVTVANMFLHTNVIFILVFLTACKSWELSKIRTC